MHASVFGETGRRVALSWLCFGVLNPGAAAGCWVRWDFCGSSVLSPVTLCQGGITQVAEKKKAFAGEEEAECRHEDGRYDLVQVARSLSEECMLNFASMAHRNRSDWQIVCRRTGLHTLTRSFPPSLCLFLSLPSSLFPSLSTPEANALAGLQTSRCQIGGPYSCWQRLRQWLGKEHV